MSRSGYSDDIDNWQMIKYRGQVASAIRGRRGQAFLRELLAALDSLPDPRLVENEIENAAGEVCALGSVARKRGMDARGLDPDEPEYLASEFGIAHQLIREIEFENDERGSSWGKPETPEQRFTRIRNWVVSNLKADAQVED